VADVEHVIRRPRAHAFPVLRRHSRVSPQPSVSRSPCPPPLFGRPFRIRTVVKRRTAACVEVSHRRQAADDRCAGTHPVLEGQPPKRQHPPGTEEPEATVRTRRPAPDHPEQSPPTEVGRRCQGAPSGRDDKSSRRSRVPPGVTSGPARKRVTGVSQQRSKTPSEVRCLSAESDVPIVYTLDCLPSAFRSQGFSPSQRFHPGTPSWLCFKPHPPIGFMGLQSFSRRGQP
jgi:hypothetical protein